MKRFLLIILLAVPVMAQVARNRTITFEDPNDSSQVTGYHIYYGKTQGGPYDLGKIDLVKGVTTTQIQLPKGTYYFVATAYNPDSESGYSNEATTTIYDNAMKLINLKIVIVP
jgi:hypothetical protein